MTSFELLASECKGELDCPKIARRQPGILTVIGPAVTDSAETLTLRVSSGEAAVEISEQLLRDAYLALERQEAP